MKLIKDLRRYRLEGYHFLIKRSGNYHLCKCMQMDTYTATDGDKLYTSDWKFTFVDINTGKYIIAFEISKEEKERGRVLEAMEIYRIESDKELNKAKLQVML